MIRVTAESCSRSATKPMHFLSHEEQYFPRNCIVNHSLCAANEGAFRFDGWTHHFLGHRSETVNWPELKTESSHYQLGHMRHTDWWTQRPGQVWPAWVLPDRHSQLRPRLIWVMEDSKDDNLYRLTFTIDPARLATIQSLVHTRSFITVETALMNRTRQRSND